MALRNLRAGVSNQTFSTAQKEYLSKLRLEPTHYALKIYPRNETEQWAIERTEGISISYLPFDCVQLPQQKQQLYKAMLLTWDGIWAVSITAMRDTKMHMTASKI